MNGVMQFSVLDGWWVEGYKEGAGWMLPMERTYQDQKFQDELDAELIYNTIEEQIVPLYYNRRNENNIPTAWVHSIKKCVADIASNFTTNRMLNDYEDRFYHKLAARKADMKASNFAMAREIAAWKRHVSSVWDLVKIVGVQKVDIDKEAIYVGGKYHIEVSVEIADLRPEDIGAEFVIASQIENGQNVKVVSKQELTLIKCEGNIATYATDVVPEHTGSYDSAIRVFPKNEKLPHRMDFALVKWA
jgi:phosphorylase/glycogen(starch) synthase